MVSIHAPAWGATSRAHWSTQQRLCFNPRARVGRDRLSDLRLSGIEMFQSTRPRGARPGSTRGMGSPTGFNPRARVGRDIKAGISHDLDWSVSIHAPAWGATGSRPGGPSYVGSFNPRARVGRDKPFQLRILDRKSFNPRARVGRDFQPCILPRCSRDVSIHAPAWGATPSILLESH